MKRKKLIPKPPAERQKVFTAWGYTFQNGGEIPTFGSGGKLQNGVMLYQSGNVVRRTDRTEPFFNFTTKVDPQGVKTTKGYSYKGTRVDVADTPSAYVRGGKSQSQETIDKNNRAMETIRNKFKDVKTQQDVVRLLQENKIKPYEAQLLVQAIANERSDYLGREGKLTPEYKDEESGFTFKTDELGRVTTKRDLLNKLLQERAKAGDEAYKGWENLSEDLDYETGLINKTKKVSEPEIVMDISAVQVARNNIEIFLSRTFPNGNINLSKYDLRMNTYSDIKGLVDRYASLEPRSPENLKLALELERRLDSATRAEPLKDKITATEAARRRSEQVLNTYITQAMNRDDRFKPFLKDATVSNSLIRFTIEKFKEFTKQKGRNLNALFDGQFVSEFFNTHQNEIIEKARQMKSGSVTM